MRKDRGMSINIQLGSLIISMNAFAQLLVKGFTESRH